MIFYQKTLKEIQKNIKAIEIRDKQLAYAKKILKSAQTSYDSNVRENKQLKEYIGNIKQRFNQYQRQQEKLEKNLLWEKEYFQIPQKII